ncbi:MAG TPA: DUF885 domain-containing protein [Caulobacteraceae bacterium]|jgi:uncharacterized protein (DUF885 family)|nr:DUF885 domain-containing protein [Caulobacteraceae bacterium]
MPRTPSAFELNRRAMVGVALAVPAFAGHAFAQPMGDEAARLNRLIAASVKADGLLDPLAAARFGGDSFVDPLSDHYAQARLAAKTSEAAELASIDRSRLEPIERLAYDVFKYKTDETLEEFSSGLFEIERMTPLDPSFGLQVNFPDAASGAGAPFKTVADYEAGLRRLDGFSDYLNNTVVRLKEGVANGYVQPRILVQNVLAQVDVMLALQPRDTPFYKPLLAMPADIPAADQARLRAAYREVIETRVLGGYRLWKTYLTETYLPIAREAPGLVAQKDGARIYVAALRHHTTTALDAEAIHKLGLSEIVRIRGEMEAVRKTLAFPGDLHALFEHVRTDPQFYYKRPEDLLARFKSIEAKIWLGIPRLFNRRPKAAFEVRPLPSMGDARGTGYFNLGPADGSAPGVLYFNMSMLSTRPIPTLETLTLHEGIPGHYFQGSLAQENTRLPDILRFGGDFTAYIEGWGLYSESLGKPLGLFTDPWQWFGHLDFEMLRAVRLVADTGMHAKGWTREQAIDFMTVNTSMAARDIRVEIDRYIAAPGQATAYKVGELKLHELCDKAQKALGARFNIKDFHDQVIMTGSMPLGILEAKIDAWIADGAPAYA